MWKSVGSQNRHWHRTMSVREIIDKNCTVKFVEIIIVTPNNEAQRVGVILQINSK